MISGPKRKLAAIIEPEQFVTVFKETSKSFEKKLLDAWNDTSLYTQVMLGHRKNESLLQNVAGILELEYYTEYWNIDAVFYKNRDKNYPDEPPYAEYLSIVLEHENMAPGAYEEVYKLSTYNSPLKVLITYPDSNKHEVYLKEYSEILLKSDVFDDFTTDRKHLMIFGEKIKDQLKWRCYFWTENGFKEINS